jgi:hypothetical protein
MKVKVKSISFVNKEFDGNEVVVFTEVFKDEDGQVIERKSDPQQNNMFIGLNEDDPKIMIPKDLICEPKIPTEEEIIGEEVCHGEAMGSYEEQTDILGGSFSIRAVI